MIKLVVMVSVCIKISTGYYEDIAGYNSFPSIDNSASSGWQQQAFYATGEPQGLRRKPCRRINSQASEQWLPSFKAMVTEPQNNNVLESQALIENVDNPPTEPSPNVDPNETNVLLNTPNRRSNTEELPNVSDEQVENGDYDCEIGLGSEDYYDSQYGRQLGDSLGLSTEKTTFGIEQKVIEMLKDCINKKQKYIDDKLSQLDGIPLFGSRRSMGNFDNDSENDDLKSADDVDDKQATTDTNEISTIALVPGKLYNELKNPDMATGIADFPVSRRMPAGGSRICYACSTATNPSCWNPDSKTTIKYCREDQKCVTKSIGVKNSLTVLRDCAVSCDSSGVAGIEPKYKSCSVCNKDYCNSAAINSYNLVIILLITAIKCTF